MGMDGDQKGTGSVRDEQSFVAFVEALGADFTIAEAASSSSYSAGALGWKDAMKSLTTQCASRWTVVFLRVSAL